ncbi:MULTISPECIES: putative leader peptide [Streptomyces]|uniref:Leader peptide n=1 Tax=Streptomyces solicathayae TaxID=3081768 RepID=A0ABZ0LNP8_9ACTN|nr:putative leader peptide [Streptomyces sp. HUAS YS2]WOX21092.1 putative leader peptide [Streptomyces sp. HUAS YS2]
MTNGRPTTRSAPIASPVTPGLTRRRHIDLARVAGTACR